MQDDNFLIDAFLTERSESAFRQLYRNKTPPLYQMALRLTANQFIAEELVQRTWVLAIEKLQNFQRRSSLKTWLTGILINLLREEVKKEIKKKKTIQEAVADKAYSTATSLDTLDLEEAIKRLAPGYRQVLVLHDIEGYTHREIGELLEISSGTSKSQLFQARSILRKQLFDNYKTQ